MGFHVTLATPLACFGQTVPGELPIGSGGDLGQLNPSGEQVTQKVSPRTDQSPGLGESDVESPVVLVVAVGIAEHPDDAIRGHLAVGEGSGRHLAALQLGVLRIEKPRAQLADR